MKGQDLDKQCAFGGSLCCFGGQKNDETRWKYDGKGHLIRESSHLYRSCFEYGSSHEFLTQPHEINLCVVTIY